MNSPLRHLVVATAGHIDHGKTALVRALTGMETDRLKEEKQRGITIELGFAFLGDNITIIDVPGHERFIKTMAAGVSTVDLALLIVAADDGIMPQTKEHLAILSLLGVPYLFTVISKTAGQDPEWVDLIEEEIREILPDRYRLSARFFRCDSLSGEGIPELRKAITFMSEQIQPRSSEGVFRLPVDRSFSMKGYGAIVTGTALNGSVKTGEHLRALPPDIEIRIRGMQCHGVDRKVILAGERAALNLIGSEVEKIKRGHWICVGGFLKPTEVVDIEIETINEAPILKNRDRVRMHIGTDEVIGRVMLIGMDAVSPGGSSFGQFIAEKLFMAARGDRFIIRRYSPLQTLGGGRIIDTTTEKRRRSRPESLENIKLLAAASDKDVLLEKIKISGMNGLSISVTKAFMGIPDDEIRSQIERLIEQGSAEHIGTYTDGWLISIEALSEVKKSILLKLAKYHIDNPQKLGLKAAALADELALDLSSEIIEFIVEQMLESELTLEKGFLRKKSHSIQLDSETEALCDRVEALLMNLKFSPPELKEMQKELGISITELNRIFSILIQMGRVVRMGDRLPRAKKNVSLAWSIIKPIISEDKGAAMSALRDALECRRKDAVIFVEYFDQLRLTERREDLRFPGRNYDKEV